MKEEVEYLGVVLDQALKCSCIINKIVSISINTLKFIYRNTKRFNWQIKRRIVLAMVQCHYDYACGLAESQFQPRKGYILSKIR